MSQSPVNGFYSIQQVADITGISKQLVRKWEERYEIVQPKRLDNGYRVYTEKDINTILRVKTLSEEGYSIKQAANIIATNTPSEVPPILKPIVLKEGMNEFVIDLLHNGTHWNEEGINYVLQQAYHQLGLESAINTVIIPFLKEVGNRWEKGEWDESQESFASILVRDFLVRIRRNFQMRDDAPLVLGACLPFERHEIPVLLLLLKFMLRGYRTIMVGSSPAPGAMESIIKSLKPAKVLLSAITTKPFEEHPTLLEDLEQFAATQPTIDFYLGGSGSLVYTEGKQLKSIRVTNEVVEILD
ncbi:MAG TPA: MerR family transcriptional regulator [Pseudoneobacillus sp.]|nr:MerR family transcriptional regulator [Pseudoneobacillus sp.]